MSPMVSAPIWTVPVETGQQLHREKRISDCRPACGRDRSARGPRFFAI
uniref:Uncharacterized protein n=1 Tax=Anguilla anguilla TaxID=7936 RepID=A0A0E9VJ58_ANGAN